MKKKRELQPGEVEVPIRFRRRGVSYRWSPKRCYERAFTYVMANDDLPGVVLVHGVLLRPFFFAHAWVELDVDGLAVVFDGVQQRFYDRDWYCQTHGAKAERRYTFQQVCETSLQFGHTGPWHGPNSVGPPDRRRAYRPPIFGADRQ